VAETRGASRYDALIATLVGFFALCVSSYTAYMPAEKGFRDLGQAFQDISKRFPDIGKCFPDIGKGLRDTGNDPLLRHRNLRALVVQVLNSSRLLAPPGERSASNLHIHIQSAG